MRKRKEKPPAQMGRPPLPEDRRRVRVSYRVRPQTAAEVEKDRREGEGLGQVIDRWVADRGGVDLRTATDVEIGDQLSRGVVSVRIVERPGPEGGP